jgi:hypothetical protein
MKYLITESQMDNVIFTYLDNQDFIKIREDDRVLFKNSSGDINSVIVYDKESEVCKLHYKLVKEISLFFSMEPKDSEQVIGRWVEKTLEMRVSHVKPLSAAQKRGAIWL